MCEADLDVGLFACVGVVTITVVLILLPVSNTRRLGVFLKAKSGAVVSIDLTEMQITVVLKFDRALPSA